jgi:hypothetical protein
MKLFLSLLLLAATGFASFAQSTSLPENQEKQVDPFIREHKVKRARNPEGVLFTVRFKDNRKQFHQGEVLSLELSFAASTPKTYTLDTASYDRSGRLPIDGFILDPRDGVVDPLDDYFNSNLFNFGGGGLRGIPELTDKPQLLNAELNEWKRFDKPGRYRLYVVSGRIGTNSTLAAYYGGGKAVTSNVVEFEILPHNKKWANQKLNEALTVLSRPDGDHRSACRTLRFLGTTAAASEMIRRFGRDDRKCDFEFNFGLISSPHRNFVMREMENAIGSPEQPVTSTFVSTLALFEFIRQSTTPPPYPVNGTDAQIQQWHTYMERRRSSLDQLRLNYLRQLFTAILEKEGQARATSLQTLLDSRSLLTASEITQLPALLASMPDVFSRLPLEAQVHILQYQWNRVANTAMLPVLRAILKDRDKKIENFRQWDLRSLALRRLYELSPEEGRRIIVDEIRRPEPRVDESVLRSLPEETLPELNNLLAANLEQSVGPNGSGNTEAISELIERYATDEILPQVRAVYEAPGVGRWACRIQASLLAYFLRVDPSAGGEHLNKALAARGKDSTRCYTSALVDVARLHMSAEVEDVATASLDDEDPEIVSHAANVLAEYGSANAEKALWRRLEKMHEAGAEMSGQAAIEQALRKALASGQAWLSDPEKLKRLRDLCLTDVGRKEVDGMIRNWNYQIFVGLSFDDGEPYSITVAHYELKTFAALKEKLLQFPKGTLFKWRTGPPRAHDTKPQEVFQKIKNHLEEHGMKLERETEP